MMGRFAAVLSLLGTNLEARRTVFAIGEESAQQVNFQLVGA